MKKASFFATIVLFMLVIGYLSPKEAKAIIIIGGYVGPFSLVSRDQAVQIHIVNVGDPTVGDPTGLREGEACTVEVKFFSPDGMDITDGTSSCKPMEDLMGMEILTCGFMPDPEDFEGRNPFVAKVTVMGSNPRACMVLITGEVYDMESMMTDFQISFTFPHL
jgi:hypothetical protein